MNKAFIGEVLAGEEEFLNGQGTYIDDEGNIRASVIGEIAKDMKKKEISVKGKLQQAVIGDFATCQVTDVKDKVIMTDILEIVSSEGNKKMNWPSAGVILIANVSSSFLDSIRQAVKIGDIIKAKIVGVEPTDFLLSLKEPDCGVIMSFCSSCRSRLSAKEPDRKYKDLTLMECEKCRQKETRRITKDYFFKKR